MKANLQKFLPTNLLSYILCWRTNVYMCPQLHHWLWRSRNINELSKLRQLSTQIEPPFANFWVRHCTYIFVLYLCYTAVNSVMLLPSLPYPHLDSVLLLQGLQTLYLCPASSLCHPPVGNTTQLALKSITFAVHSLSDGPCKHPGTHRNTNSIYVYM